MKFVSIAPSLAIAAFALTSTAFGAPAAKPVPKVTKAHAISIALKAQPGTIVASELEAEKGGSGLRYSFDIKVGKKTHEVGVDAATGAVLENIVEGKNPD